MRKAFEWTANKDLETGTCKINLRKELRDKGMRKLSRTKVQR